MGFVLKSYVCVCFCVVGTCVRVCTRAGVCLWGVGGSNLGRHIYHIKFSLYYVVAAIVKIGYSVVLQQLYCVMAVQSLHINENFMEERRLNILSNAE